MTDAPPVVLIVDDHEEARRSHAAVVESLGFVAYLARDGQEAIELAPTLRPAAVLMDVRMPRMDGLEATRWLKNDPRTAAIPILVITAFATPANCDRALVAGADDFLQKPCDPDALASCLARSLGR